MARPPTIRDETIIEAARAVFLARGIQATTAEVAERAGVSEGSIFNRFKSKEELFQAAMAQDFAGPPEWIKSLERRAGKGELKDQLYELGLEIIAFFQKTIPLTMMAWSNAPCENWLPRHLGSPNPPPLRGLKAVVRFFEAETRAGRMRRHDPEVLARSYMGSLHTYAFFDVLYRAHDELPLAAEVYVRGLVHLIWTGAAPRRKGE
jgi:AcrR family transcriptional regulator